MSKDILVIPDQHAHYQFGNQRADYIANFINAVHPDVVVNIGDAADMPSLSGYDKGRKSFQGRTYRADIESHLEFQDRLWGPVRRRKKRLPYRVFTEGNHEYRIKRAIDMSPELEGAVSFDDLNLREWYDDIVEYDGKTPGVINVEGINFAHYFVSGVEGRPIGGAHPATSLLDKQFASCVCGHLHLVDWSVRTNAENRKIMAVFAGAYYDYRADWAGKANDLWWNGLVYLRNVDNGVFDPEFISMDRLRRAYGQDTGGVDG